tara:strand:+ start:1188 stop:1382 length:195 start_codon:yes stop_codon:yes gene_type:complete
MKYKNKDGVELSYEGHKNDTHIKLVKQVIREAIRIGDNEIYPSRAKPIFGWRKVKKFLKENFSV